MIERENILFSRSIHEANNQTRAPAPSASAIKPPRVRPGEPAGQLVRAALKAAMSRIQAADPEARRGEIEGIHRLRTSTRRLRSELHTVRKLVDRGWREHLEGELKWLAGVLAGVRDLDILRDRLHGAMDSCSNEKKSGNGDEPDFANLLEPLFRTLDDRHARNSQALRDALQGERYRNLVAQLEASIEHPPLKNKACEPCRIVLPPLAAAAWQRLKKGARALTTSTPEEDFHEVRKRAKRARYTAELIAPALGRRAEKKASRFIRLTTKVQDVLGEHQDAVVAAAEIEQFVGRIAPQEKTILRAARDLLASQRRAIRVARDKFFECWDRLDRKKSVRWLKARHKCKSHA